MAVHGFNVDVRADFARLTANINRFERNEIPFVTAYALTKTAQDIRAEEYKAMAAVFDRPTRFTLNSLQVKGANKHNLQAKVEFKEGFNSIPAWKYLGPQVEGGARKKKSHERHLERAGILRPDEYVVPGAGAQLDAHGNMRGGHIVRILSQLGAAENASGYMANITARSRKTKRHRARGTYFAVRDHESLPDGIYHSQGARKIVPVMMFVSQPQYDKRYPYFATADQTYRRVFPRHFRAGWRRYVRVPNSRPIPF
jgi:hypothetical protein